MLTRKARFTVKAKISAWIGVVVILGLLSMLYIYRSLGRVSEYLNHLAQVSVPFSTSTIEMEKNTQEYSSGVLRYINFPHPDIRVEAEGDSADFFRHQAAYMRASSDERKLKLGRRLAARHSRLHAMGAALMHSKNELDGGFRHATDLLEEIDRIIDDQMPPALSGPEQVRSRTLAALANVEAEAAEIGFWLSTYDSRPTGLARQRLVGKITELAEAISKYRSLPLSPMERHLGAEIASLQEKFTVSIDDLLAREDAFNVLLRRFVDLESEINELFDGKVDAVKDETLAEPQKNADRALGQAQVALRYVIPSYLLVALAASVLLILAIVRPLRRLASGTEAIGAGDLGYRVAEQDRDEFGDLARQFNRMVMQLQETTVSKSRLETSEHKLRLTVDELKQEIAERAQSEREREKLQAELRRSEAMAAIGALVAGVSHEVRNPLFGISSTLDAMEASAGEGGGNHRHREVLRREVNRLNKLMTDLLEYGRPPTDEFTIGRLGKVVAEAVRVCSPAAEASGVAIVNNAAAYEGMLRMNHGRLLQVFVNLIENAVQHAPAGTEVILAAEATTDAAGRRWIACSVADCGPGFAPEDLPFVFDPFFTRRRKGTGLGLAIVQRIVDEHGGTIEPRNRPGGGAMVIVRLPTTGEPQ